MLKKSDGFTLIEVMAALAVLTITAATTIPLLTQVYRERISVSQEREALAILQNRIELWTTSGKSSVPKNSVVHRSGTVYRMSWHLEDGKHTVKTCISWQGRNERRYEQCGYAKTPAVSP